MDSSISFICMLLQPTFFSYLPKYLSGYLPTYLHSNFSFLYMHMQIWGENKRGGRECFCVPSKLRELHFVSCKAILKSGLSCLFHFLKDGNFYVPFSK